MTGLTDDNLRSVPKYEHFDACKLDATDGERLWIPQALNDWFRPLCLSASRGYWMNILRVRKPGVLSRHRHPQPVHGYVIKCLWRYLEHDWTATEGAYVYEAPGETHSLVVEADVTELMTMF